jgi:D-alanyl-D-alanine dipeptidase
LALQKTLRDLTPGALLIDVSKQMAQIRLLRQQAADALMVIYYLLEMVQDRLKFYHL